MKHALRLAPRHSLLLLPLAAPALGAQQEGAPEEDPVGGLASLVAPDEGPAVLELSLADATRMALETNIDIRIEAENAEIARLDWRGSWGAFDPIYTLDLSHAENESAATFVFAGQTAGTIIESQTDRLTSSLSVPMRTGGDVSINYERREESSTSPFAPADADRDILTLSLSQPLLEGAGRSFSTADQRAAELEYQKQMQRTRTARQNLLRDVEVAYWDVVAARELLEVSRLSLELGRRQLDQNERRLDVGVGTEVDVLQAEADVATREEELLRAEVDLRAAEDTLRSLILPKVEESGGVEGYREAWDVELVPVTDLPEPDPSQAREWSASLGLALMHRPDLEEQLLEVDRAQVQLQKTSSQRLPNLDLSLNVVGEGLTTQDVEFQVFDFDVVSTTALLSFSTPIGNRTQANAERSARAALRRARLEYERIELAVATEVRSAVRDVTYQTEAVEAAEKSLELARRQLEAEEARYAEGLSTTFQVLEFQRDLAQALSGDKAARAAYAKALVNLARAEGRIGERVATP